MSVINVGLGERSYPIHILHNADYGALLRQALPKTTDLMVVTNDTVGPLYLEQVTVSLEKSGFKVSSHVLKDGESYKTVESWWGILSALLERNFARDGALAALGGGVVGDMTGFAAAVYQRGVPYVQLPTTLLAMVDSSVGGKTAINHPQGKNMIGAFYQPQAVVAALKVLGTLPPRELSAGLAEAIKTAFIYDEPFIRFMQEHSGAVFTQDEAVLTHIVERCCAIKAQVVEADEREGGLRAILNFGHTFGHALEAYLGFGTWLHGEAVGLGMCLAAALSLSRNLIDEDYYQCIVKLVAACNLPVKVPDGMQGSDFIRLMRHDKKVRSGVIRYVLPTAPGKVGLFADVSDEEVIAVVERYIRGEYPPS